MNLREDIKKIILENENNPETLSIEICKMLDEELSLSGNGWFDNDDVMLKALDIEDY